MITAFIHMALEQRYYEWEDAVGILLVWETDVDFTITRLLGWRARANNAEKILHAIAQIFSLITSFSPMFIEAFLPSENYSFFMPQSSADFKNSVNI